MIFYLKKQESILFIVYHRNSYEVNSNFNFYSITKSTTVIPSKRGSYDSFGALLLSHISVESNFLLDGLGYKYYYIIVSVTLRERIKL